MELTDMWGACTLSLILWTSPWLECASFDLFYFNNFGLIMFSVYLHSHAKPLQPFQNTFIHCDFSGSSFKYVRVCCKLRKRPRGHVSVFVSVSCNVYVVFHVGAVVSWSDCSIIELVPFISQPRWCVTQGLLRSADHFFKELGKLVFSAFLFSPHFWLVGVFFVLCYLSPVIYLFLLQILSFSAVSHCVL